MTGIAPTPCPPPLPATLKDFLEDGFHLLALLRAGASPGDPERFAGQVDAFLAGYDRQCARAGKPDDAARDAKYAFCALLDEAILASGRPFREAWERAPLQLRLFDDHLAGEGFFRRLEALRREPRAHLETLAVYHACLLQGFQGRHRLEGGGEQLRWLIRSLGEELLQAAGGSRGFAPRWRPSLPPGARGWRKAFFLPGSSQPAFWGGLLAAALGIYLALVLALRIQAAELAPAGPGPRAADARHPRVPAPGRS